MNQKIGKIKIKQRNTLEGVSKICGLWFISTAGADIFMIDLSPGLGQWRVQTLNKGERIIGMHSYAIADDESMEDQEENQPKKVPDNDEEGNWLSSLGFIVYQYPVKDLLLTVKRPRGRPRIHPIV